MTLHLTFDHKSTDREKAVAAITYLRDLASDKRPSIEIKLSEIVKAMVTIGFEDRGDNKGSKHQFFHPLLLPAHHLTYRGLLEIHYKKHSPRTPAIVYSKNFRFYLWPKIAYVMEELRLLRPDLFND